MDSAMPNIDVNRGSPDLLPGRYRHYKGKEYTVIGLALHSETLEELVVYRQEYGEHGLWVRPKRMFQELVNVDGHVLPRFQYLGTKKTTHKDKPLTPQQARQKLQQGFSDFLAGKDTGPITIRLKKTRKASDVYPLKLNQQQRYTLIHCTRLSRSLKNKFEQAGEGVQVIEVSWKELDHLYNETAQSAVYAPSADRKRLMAVQEKLIKYFEEENAKIFGS